MTPICPTPGSLPESSPYPVRYFNGELQYAVPDLSGSGFGFPWGHTRIYSNQLATNYNVGQGYNWMVKEWQYLVQVSATTVQLVRGRSRPYGGTCRAAATWPVTGRSRS